MSNAIFKLKNIDWTPFLFLTLTPFATVIAMVIYFMNYEVNYWLFLVAAIFYALTAMSITAGYHRLFSHKAYDAHWLTRLFYALFGAAAFQNSILKWATEHRIHHRFVDTDEDPYTIKKGFFFAHIGWMLQKTPQSKYFNAYSRDLKQDKIVMWQHKYYIPIAVTVGFFLPMTIGYFMGSVLGGLAIPALLRIVALHHGTFFINSACHVWGSQPYTDENTAKDNFVLALFTFGEGYHNYHHKFANDYRNGIRWYQWDPTKWAIRLQSFVGLAKNLKRTPDEEIVKAKFDFELDVLKEKLGGYQTAVNEKIEEYKETIVTVQLKVQTLKKQYSDLLDDSKVESKAKLEQIKKDLQKTQDELAQIFAQWRVFRAETLAQYC